MRKRKKREDEQPPWCYYCDRVFSDEQTLVQHQKAKHFKVTSLVLDQPLFNAGISISRDQELMILCKFLSCHASNHLMCALQRGMSPA